MNDSTEATQEAIATPRIDQDQLAEYMTTSEASAILGVSEGMVRRLLRSGRLQGLPPRESWLVLRDSVGTYEPPIRGWPKGKPRRVHEASVHMGDTQNDQPDRA